MSETLKQGSKGEAVSALQNKLVALGWPIDADGAFGPATKAAVEELQSVFGYDVDGIVGSGTLSLIDAQIGHRWNVNADGAIKRALEAQGKTTDKGSLAGAELKRTLKAGLEGSDVAYLQRRLATLGYPTPSTGKFDDNTAKAVRALQESFGYTVDGIVGPGTNTLINAQIGHGWNAAG
ncbi:MAG: peptidoglycan-binding protein [Sandaracinaceae bacterium]|nr:peptidoglycan-binding protein [Sandaracinaceae bacterium]